MTFLICAAFVLLMVFSVTFRVLVTHPVSTVYYAVRDFYKYLRYHRWHELETGKLIAYCALFGGGKTLSVVHYVRMQYFKYNDKRVFDFNRKKWVTQKVHIVSNVDLTDVPYEKFVSLSQIVRIADTQAAKDAEDDTLTVTLVLGDEFSVQMNSRNFKSNIDPLFLNSLLTCRHHHISMIYDSQRFQHVDALLRQVTSYVVSCQKVWRVVVSERYDAWDLENAASPSMVTPQLRFGWFVRDKDYNAYDTLACVDNLSRSCKEGDMLTEDQILALQCRQPSDMDAVGKPSRLFRRNKRRQNKLL